MKTDRSGQKSHREGSAGSRRGRRRADDELEGQDSRRSPVVPKSVALLRRDIRRATRPDLGPSRRDHTRLGLKRLHEVYQGDVPVLPDQDALWPQIPMHNPELRQMRNRNRALEHIHSRMGAIMSFSDRTARDPEADKNLDPSQMLRGASR
jgi:hypothetical protein